MRTAIIGAGASGLSLALLLDGGKVVYESDEEVGGHCRSRTVDGWTFDRGPHIMFSRNAPVLDFMVRSLGTNVHRSRRKNVVCVSDRFVKYPIENDLASLPDELRNRCLLEFLFNDAKELAGAPSNLEDWFIGNFGAALTDLYFKPYNEKLWKVPLAELSMSWADRIPSPPPIDVVKGALGIQTEGYVHQLYFHYPRRGGYGAIPKAWSHLLPGDVVRLRTPVLRLDPQPNGVDVVTTVGTERFDRVVCTAPMDNLVQMVSSTPERVRAAIARLQVNAIGVITLGFRGEDRHQHTALYMADPEYLPNRASAPSVFSPLNAPPGCFSIQSEITCGPGCTQLNVPNDTLIEHVYKGLLRYGIVSGGQPMVFADVQRFERAYVVYTIGYEREVETVRDWAESLGIYIHGRFGAFNYLNVDGCVEHSIELATKLNRRRTSLSEVPVAQEAV